MLVEDVIYGRFIIEDQVLVDLMNAPTLLKLKDVSQRGYPDIVRTSSPVNYTRYEHSVGCMLLLRKLNASLEEQIAGLLHDVSHTAFSHVADWLFGKPTEQAYQDRILKDYIMKSELPEILKRNGFNSEKISEIEEAEHFGLMERKAPELCVDRADYTLRDLHYTLRVDVSAFVSALTVRDGHLVFKNFDIAYKFAKLYSRCNTRIWASPDNIVRYYLISQMLKRALELGVIANGDMHMGETQVISKVMESKDLELRSFAERSLGELRYRLVPNGVHLKTKFRYIDPEFIDGNRVIRVSQLFPEYREQIRKEKARDEKGITVEFY